MEAKEARRIAVSSGKLNSSDAVRYLLYYIKTAAEQGATSFFVQLDVFDLVEKDWQYLENLGYVIDRSDSLVSW